MDGLEGKHSYRIRQKDGCVTKGILTNSTLFENSAVKQALKELLKKYVLVPVDKATGNIVIICRRFYMLTMIKELGLERDTSSDTNSTYETCNNIQEYLLIATHCKDLCNDFHLSVTYEIKVLPLLLLVAEILKNLPKLSL